MRRIGTAVLTVSLALVAGGCGSVNGVNEDGQVAELFVTANQNQIDAATLASQRAYIPAVREYAQQRLAEYTGIQQRADEVFADEGFGRVPTDDSRMLAENNAMTLEKLNTYNDVTFDRAYLRSQIATHRWTLDFIDHKLLPTAHDDDLEQLLTQTRPVAAEQLRQAEALLARL